MSLNFTQIIAGIDIEAKSNSTSYPLADKVYDINLALDEAISEAIKAAGIGQMDDTNHTNFPFITTNLVSGQRDYSFLTDGSGNLILDLFSVLRMSPQGVYEKIPQVDLQSQDRPSFYDGQNQTGTPSTYDRTGNTIIFDVIPDYSQDDGVQMFIDREGSHFTISDTSKMPGLDGRVHEFLVVQPAWKHASRNDLSGADKLKERMIALKAEIRRIYAGKDKNVAKQFSRKKTPFK